MIRTLVLMIILAACSSPIPSELRPGGGSGTIDGNGGGGFVYQSVRLSDLAIDVEPVFTALERASASNNQLSSVPVWVLLMRRDLGSDRLDMRKFVKNNEVRRCEDYGTEVAAYYWPAENGVVTTIELCALFFTKTPQEQLAIVLHELSHHAIQIARGKANVTTFNPANDRSTRTMTEEELLVHRLESQYSSIIQKLAANQDIAAETSAVNRDIAPVLGQLPPNVDLSPTAPNAQIRRIFAGSTIDACDSSETVAIGGVALAANETKEIELAGETREIFWQCGAVTERSASDDPFNSLIVSRSSTGSMLLNFYRKTVVPPPPPPTIPPVFVGETFDACDRDNVVQFEGVAFGANESRSFDLGGMVDEIFWYCDGDRERSANGRAFNRVEISRSDTGRLHLRFYIRQ